MGVHHVFAASVPKPPARGFRSNHHLIGRPPLLYGLFCVLSAPPSSREYRLTICSRSAATLLTITCSIVCCPGVAIHCIMDDRKSSFKYAKEKFGVDANIMYPPFEVSEWLSSLPWKSHVIHSLFWRLIYYYWRK